MSTPRTRRLAWTAGALLLASPALCLAEPASLAEAAKLAATTAAEPGTAAEQAEAAGIDEKAAEIYERYLDAMGGREKLSEIQSRTDTLSISIPAMGMNGSGTVYSTAEGQVAMTMELPMMGKIQQGFDGEHGWIIDPINGAQMMPAEMITEMRRDSSFSGILRPETIFSSIAYKGEEEFQGAKAHALVFTDERGQEQTRYFDAESGQMIGSKGTSATPMGTIEIVSIYSDFKKFGDFTFPGRMTQSFGPVEQVMEFTQIEINSVDPAVFEMPEAIRTLIDQEKKAETQTP